MRWWWKQIVKMFVGLQVQLAVRYIEGDDEAPEHFHPDPRMRHRRSPDIMEGEWPQADGL